MNAIALDLGIMQIYWYSIFILLAVAIASIIVYLQMKKLKINEQVFFDLSFNTVIIGLIGARIYYILFNLTYYLKNPIEILEVWNGGLAIHGAIIFGGIYLIYYCKKYNYKILKLLDIISVGLILGQAIGRWGNFFNQEAFGTVTTLTDLQTRGIPQFIINGMNILGEYHEPTFFYESIWNFFGFVALIIIRLCPTIKTGQLTGTYLLWYSIGRFVIEGHRTDSLMILNFKMAQIISVILAIIGIILILRGILKKDKVELYHKEGLRNGI